MERELHENKRNLVEGMCAGEREDLEKVISGKELSETVQKLVDEWEVEMEKLPESIRGIILYPNDYTHERHEVRPNIQNLLGQIKSLLACLRIYFFIHVCSWCVCACVCVCGVCVRACVCACLT